MTQEPKRNGNIQLNLNSILLAICVSLSGWALKSIEELKSQVSGLVPQINANASAIMGINKVNQHHSDKLEDLSDRIIKLETIIQDHPHHN